jgi:hypothetical protein
MISLKITHDFINEFRIEETLQERNLMIYVTKETLVLNGAFILNDDGLTLVRENFPKCNSCVGDIKVAEMIIFCEKCNKIISTEELINMVEKRGQWS